MNKTILYLLDPDEFHLLVQLSAKSPNKIYWQSFLLNLVNVQSNLLIFGKDLRTVVYKNNFEKPQFRGDFQLTLLLNQIVHISAQLPPQLYLKIVVRLLTIHTHLYTSSWELPRKLPKLVFKDEILDAYSFLFELSENSRILYSRFQDVDFYKIPKLNDKIYEKIAPPQETNVIFMNILKEIFLFLRDIVTFATPSRINHFEESSLVALSKVNYYQWLPYLSHFESLSKIKAFSLIVALSHNLISENLSLFIYDLTIKSNVKNASKKFEVFSPSLIMFAAAYSITEMVEWDYTKVKETGIRPGELFKEVSKELPKLSDNRLIYLFNKLGTLYYF